MKMQPPQIQMRRRNRLQNRPLRIPRLYGKPELGINDARSRISVRMRVNARRYPHQNVLRPPGGGANPFQQLQLVKAVHHDAPDAGHHRLRQLLRRLVVPVKIYLLRRHGPGHRHRQLPAGHHIQAQPLLRKDARQRRIDIRLGSIHRLRIGIAGRKSPGELPAPRPQRRLVQRIKRRAVLLRQIQSIAPANRQMPAGINRSGIRKNLSQVRGQHQKTHSGSKISRYNVAHRRAGSQMPTTAMHNELQRQ